MDGRCHQGQHSQHRQFRTGTGQSDVRRRRPRARKTFPVTTLQLPVVASQRRGKNRTNLSEVLSVVPLTAGLTDEALQLRDGDACLGDSAAG